MEKSYFQILPALRKVSARLSALDSSDFLEDELHYPSVHLLRTKSKMLRPSLVLLGAYAIGERPEKFIDLAVASELIHVSSLIHDDIIDRDRKRRGVEAVHVRYGNPAAILAGDALISKAVEIAAKYGRDTLESMSRATMSMCAGEALDYRYRKRNAVPGMAQYKRIAYLKSGALIGACWNAASVFRATRLSDRMYNAGSALGIAFQIRDDIFDFIRSARRNPKHISSPNIVTSVQKDSGTDRYNAVARAVELNNRYIDSSIRQLSDTREGSVLAAYSAFIRVAV